MRDHLGNNRIVVAVSSNSHQAVQATDYDPFGMPFPNGVNPERQPYKFGGKELDDMNVANALNPFVPVKDRARSAATAVGFGAISAWKSLLSRPKLKY
jgi:hypothetical protein